MTFLLLLTACTGADGPEGQQNDASEVVHVRSFTATSDDDGYVSVPVEVTEGVDVFQVVAKRARGTLSTDYVYGPDGGTILDWEDWYDSSYSLTDCFFPSTDATTFDWPIRAEDGPLVPGTYQVQIATLTAGMEYAGGEDVDIDVLTRAEPDPAAGSLHAIIAYATGVRDEEGVVDGVEAAVAHWEEIYAAIGITLEPEYSDIDVDPALPDTYEGLDAYTTLLEAQGEHAVLLVVGESIAADDTLYGEAGSIPGPYVGTPHSAVEVSWLANAGADAEFSNADIQLFGETMAHEVGHYLGLYHPVEDGYDYWDALDDTEECSSWTRCDEDLGSNLMYPYPVCTGAGAGTCVRQDELTGMQAGVANGYLGIE
jgi:hypothetical protein